MKEERIHLTMNELSRLEIIQRSLRGDLTVSAASRLIALTERQIYRLRTKVRTYGPPGIAHGNRGQPSKRKTCQQVADRIVRLARTEYQGFNDTHYTEKLLEDQHLAVSRETVRKLLRAHGLGPKRKRKSPKHRSRRPRKECAGDMIQFDGSPHDWLSGRGPKLCLLVGIDDATSYPWARFELAETTDGYFRLTKQIIQGNGLFTSIYADKHSIFQIEHGRLPTVEEQLAGKLPTTQFERALQELGITLIAAHSPQAKGRVERIHQVFQDRLVAELDRVQASSIAQATPVLNKVLGVYRRKFALTAPSAFRSLPDGVDLDACLCHKETRTVANDNCFSFNNRLFQLPPTTNRISWTKTKVEVHTLPNGIIRAVYQGHIIKTFKPTEGSIPLAQLRKEQAGFRQAYSLVIPDSIPCYQATTSSP
jgi:transposase